MDRYKTLLLILATLFLAGCQVQTPEPYFSVSFAQDEPITITATIEEVEDPAPIAPTATPTMPVELVNLTATVWGDLPKAPVLMYHRFDPQPGAVSYLYTTSLTDFRNHLTSLYNAGFSLISLNDWLKGDIDLPDGRRPLIITIDDLFYADQIFLDETGNPAPYSGIGFLWEFSHEYPDFNFAAALFFNLGDKGYANYYQNGVFTIGDGWRQARAEVIAWAVEHGAMPLNHFYEHPFLDQLSPAEILWQIQENDKGLREALIQAGREDLIHNLPNILALPYVIWPATEAGEEVLFSYVNPEGVPIAAIVEGAYAGGSKFLEAPFSEEFSRWHIPRIGVSNQAIAEIVEQVDQIPVAVKCNLGEINSNSLTMADDITAAIRKQTDAKNCPLGYYLVDQFVFFVKEDTIVRHTP